MPERLPAIRVAFADFVAAAKAVAGLPEATAPEIAFAGRSNVGKSSLMNMLVERKSLVRTSKLPGGTRTLNLFTAKLVDGRVYGLVDLPGYGFAARSKEERKAWAQMIEGYLERRPALKVLCVLCDVRRGVGDDDRQLVEFMKRRPDVRVVLVATKLDKLPRSQRKPALEQLRKAAGTTVVGTSAETGEGREELWRRIVD
jgi:GTP-binding protein